MNIPLLDRLRDAAGCPIDRDELVRDWPGAIADIELLRAFGFELDVNSQGGVSYRRHAERLCPDQIEWELGTTRIGRRIAVWNRLASTNDLAAKAASSQANDGLVILAEEQTAGRGRRGRAWAAPHGSSILLSVLIFPSGSLDDPAWLTALGAVAVAEAVAEAVPDSNPRIKWPNDVRVDRRKIAGILVERSGGAAVIGIGLNVNAEMGDFPPELAETATSLRRLAGGYPLDRSDLVRRLIRALDHWYDLGLTAGPSSLDTPLAARSEHLGHPVRVETPLGPIVGRLEAIEVGRGITLLEATGTIVRIASREIRGLYPID